MKLPPESEQHLQELLVQLEAEIRQTPSVDPLTRHRIDQLLARVGQLLRDEPEGPTPPPVKQDLVEVIVDFEAGHPALAASLRRLLSTLSSMGI